MEKISKEDREIIRDLAAKVREIVDSPEQKIRKELWRKHNRLEKTRPLILADPDIWEELVPESEIKIKNEVLRPYERTFRQIIYRHANFNDDQIVGSTVQVPLVQDHEAILNWGEPVERVYPSQRTTSSIQSRGAWAYKPWLKDISDTKKLKIPQIIVDEGKTRLNYEILNDAIGDILPIRLNRGINLGPGIHGVFANIRGLGQLMYDLIDRPTWVQEIMEFLTEGFIKLRRQAEKMNYLDLNSKDYSGGLYYTDELPQPDFEGKVRLKDLWYYTESQEFDGVSPEMYEKYLLRYQVKVASLYGLNSYGCCENLTKKLEYIIKEIPRLRRVHISPWTDLRVAVKLLEDKYIISWRPHPNLVSTEKFDYNYVYNYMKENLAILKGCIFEVRLCAVCNLNIDPKRIGIWSKITRELIGE